MSRRNRAILLAEIVKVRCVQEQAAGMEVARSNSELNDLAGEKSGALRQLEDDQARWSAAMGAPAFDPALAGAWSAAVLETEASVQAVEARIAEAMDRKTERSQAWRLTLARADVAKDLSRAAHREQARQSEEATLSELADRFAARGQTR